MLNQEIEHQARSSCVGFNSNVYGYIMWRRSFINETKVRKLHYLLIYLFTDIKKIVIWYRERRLERERWEEGKHRALRGKAARLGPPLGRSGHMGPAQTARTAGQATELNSMWKKIKIKKDVSGLQPWPKPNLHPEG